MTNAEPSLEAPGRLRFLPSSQQNLISGISVSDADDEMLVVTLEVAGRLSLGTFTGLTFLEGDGTSDQLMTFSGAIADINAALATLSFTPSENSHTADILSISVSDQQHFDLLPGNFPAEIELSDLDGQNGFLIKGIHDFGEMARVVSSAGDLNNDGYDDFVVSAQLVDTVHGSQTGEAFIVFGSSTIGSSESIELSELDGSNGFRLIGVDENGQLGRSLSKAGDVNNDGIDDLLIGAAYGDGNSVSNSGQVFVIFGKSDIGGSGNLDTSDLNGAKGFVLNGVDAYDSAGVSVCWTGDMNGDGIDDFAIGASGADFGSNQIVGEVYIVFGAESLGSTGSLDLSSLNGANGVKLNGTDHYDYTGSVISGLGDVNGDGFDDILIGAPGGDPGGQSAAGESFVVFGSSELGSSGPIDLSDLDGSDGFVVNGSSPGDYSGRTVSSAGDVNGDGVDDLLIGAYLADPNGKSNSGESYIVFGGTGIGASGQLDLSSLNGANGFVLNGVNNEDTSGTTVSAAGDINSDGLDDIIISAPNADPNSNSASGVTYVVFGATGLGSSGSLELSALDGQNGFAINGITSYDLAGTGLSSAGDINGDGVVDIIIGAPEAKGYGSRRAGEAYIIFGQAVQVERYQSATIEIDLSLPTFRDFDEDDGSDLMFQLAGALDFARLCSPALAGTPSNEGRNGFSSIGLADMDGDGVLDNVVRAANNNYVIQFSGENSGASTVGGNAFDIVGFADLDGDGADEALATSTNPADERLYIADDGLSTLTRIGFNAQTSIGFGEFDGDGTDEILIEHSSGGKRLFDDGLGVISVGKARLVAEAIGDFNGDGLDDVLTTNPNKNGHYYLLEGDAAAPLGDATFIGYQSLELVAAGDFDGDGTLDILGNQNGTSFQMLTNGLTTLTAINFGNDTFEAIGDFNGDGNDDILLSRPSGQGRIVYSGDRNDTALIDALIGKSVRDVADYDGDGSDDLLVQDDVDGSYSILLSGVGSEIDLDASLDDAIVIDANGINTLGILPQDLPLPNSPDVSQPDATPAPRINPAIMEDTETTPPVTIIETDNPSLYSPDVFCDEDVIAISPEGPDESGMY